MRQQRGWAWVVVVCVFCVANVLAEQSGAVPRLVKFSGELKDSLGQPLTGAVDATFSIYKEETDASPIWWETQTVQADSQGRYTVLLGATRSEGLPIELFTSGEGRWLGVTVGRLPEQARVLLVSVPYAVKAEEAEKLAGKPASAFVVSQDLREMIRQEVRRQIRESQASSAVQPQAAQGSGAIASKAANSVASPPGKRQQQGPTDFVGNTADALVTMTNGTGDPLRVWGWEGMEATAVGPFSSAVVGKSVSGAGLAGSSDRGPGVLGATKDGTAAVEGTSSGNLVTAVLGTASGSGGIGVYGQSLASSGTTLGVMGVVQSPDGKAGVFANTAGGTILQGLGASSATVFAVQGKGEVRAKDYQDLNGNSVIGVHGLKEFLPSGSYSFTVPPGVTGIAVELWGAGGGSVYCPPPTQPPYEVFGGGGGGAYTRDVIAVVPGSTYKIVVGAGGAVGGGNGTDTQIEDSSGHVLRFAGGGQGGSPAGNGAGGRADPGAAISFAGDSDCCGTGPELPYWAPTDALIGYGWTCNNPGPGGPGLVFITW